MSQDPLRLYFQSFAVKKVVERQGIGCRLSRVAVVGERLRLPQLLAVVRLNLVACNTEHPRPERRVAEKIRQALERRDEDVLDNVIHQVGARREPVSYVAVDAVRILRHEPGCRLAVLAQNGRDQVSLVPSRLNPGRLPSRRSRRGRWLEGHSE